MIALVVVGAIAYVIMATAVWTVVEHESKITGDVGPTIAGILWPLWVILLVGIMLGDWLASDD